MNTNIVYLSGPISGATYKECTDWREYASLAFPRHIKGVSPLRAKKFLSEVGKIEGSYSLNPLATERGINTRDHFDVLRSKVMLVNLLGCTKIDNPRVSIGTVGEMAWAWDHGIPQVVAMEPGDINVHSHPMLNQWIDYRVETLDEAIRTVITIISHNEGEMTDNIGELTLLTELKRLKDRNENR